MGQQHWPILVFDGLCWSFLVKGGGTYWPVLFKNNLQWPILPRGLQCWPMVVKSQSCLPMGGLGRAILANIDQFITILPDIDLWGPMLANIGWGVDIG